MLTKGWHGYLDLSYGYRGNQTLVTHQYSQAPFKIQQPFYPEGLEVCHSVVLHTAGGMVGGDHLSQTIQLQPHANALITTAAASKIYGGHPQKTCQEISINVQENAVLEWFPQENIIFEGATYQQSLKVNLAPNATLFAWEVNRFGRTARGEKFSQGEWRSQTEIWQQEQPLWIDRQALQGGDLIDSPNGLAGFSVIGSLIYLGKPVSGDIIDKIRELWFNSDNQGQAGVTKSLGDGVICRYRGHSTTEVKQWLIQVWHLLRQVYLQRSGIYPRVWLL